jgi:hypothetical protein
VNFNYDTILDSFIDKTFSYSTNHIDQYIDWENRNIVHFKPHGSSNWGWRFPNDKISIMQSEPASFLYTNNITPAELYYKWLGDYREMVYEHAYGSEMYGSRIGKHSIDKLKIQIVEDEPAYPALLLPFKEKDEFVMPYHHQTALGVVLKDVERLFVVGWKGSEQLFLSQIEKATKIKEVIIVNPDFDVVKSNLKEHIKTECTWSHIEDFEAFIKREII